MHVMLFNFIIDSAGVTLKVPLHRIINLPMRNLFKTSAPENYLNDGKKNEAVKVNSYVNLPYVL